MALDKVLIIYDEQGNPVDYDILAKDVKFQPDGKDLPTKLAEMEQEIEDAAGGGYAPPAGGIPKSDLASGVQSSLDKADTALQQSDKTELQNEINNKVDKVNGKGLSTNDYTNEDKAAVATIANKANSADVYTKSQTYSKSEVDGLVADAGKVKSVTINGTKKTPNETTGDVDLGTIVGQQGPKGDQGDTLLVDGEFNPVTDIVNDMTTGGTNKAWSAEMGKRVAGREATDRQRIDAIVAILKKSVFTDDQSAAIAALDELANATDSVSLDKSSYLFNGISGTLTLTATTDPAGKSVTWSSSNPSVATVNNGVVTPIAVGSTIISATTTDGKSATCSVTVQAFVVDSVTIDQSDITSNGELVGATHQLTATTSPAGGAVLWSSSNTSVATINENTGLLAIVGNGTATITAMDATRTKTDTITVAVTNVVTPSITLNQNTLSSDGENAGSTHQLTATVVPNTDTVTWSSSDSSVATVDNTGLVTVKTNGTCTITATSSSGASATCAVTVANIVKTYVEVPLTLAYSDKYIDPINSKQGRDFILGTNNQSNQFKVYESAVNAGDEVKILSSALNGAYGQYVFVNSQNKCVEDAYQAPGYPNTNIQTYEVTVPTGAVKVYISENYSANGSGSSKLYKK